jgi:hypothetical protein
MNKFKFIWIAHQVPLRNKEFRHQTLFFNFNFDLFAFSISTIRSRGTRRGTTFKKKKKIELCIRCRCTTWSCGTRHGTGLYF